jgi:Zn-dependent protease with chaperone function
MMLFFWGFLFLNFFFGTAAYFLYRYEIRRISAAIQDHDVLLHGARRKLNLLGILYFISFTIGFHLSPGASLWLTALMTVFEEWGIGLQLWLIFGIIVFLPAYMALILPGYLWIEHSYYRLEKKVRETTWSFKTYSLQITRSFMLAVLPITVWSMALPFIPDNDTAFYLSFCFFLLTIFTIAPTLISFFYRTAELTDQDLAEMIARLCDRAGMRRCAVSVLFLSGGKVVNAMISGIFPYFRRIFLTDRLISELTSDELEAVLAHEIGHIQKRHLWGFFSLSVIFAVVTPHVLFPLYTLNFFEKHEAWMLPIALITWTTLFFGVLGNIFSRRFEREADAYGVTLTGNKIAYLSMLDKLARLNHMPKKWAKTEIDQTHPSIQKRMDFVMQLHEGRLHQDR